MADDETLDSFNEGYLDAISNAQAILRKYKYKHQDDSSSSVASGSENYADPPPSLQQKVSLPTISLPTFNGDSEQWLDFRDMFQALVHNDNNLDDAKKLYYLRGALDGNAKLVLQGIKTSAENYNAAWTCLCERYENKKLLVHKHLSAIYEIKPMRQECPKQLRDLLDKINSNMRALENLNQLVKEWDTMIIFILSKKLDTITLREWETNQQTDELPKLEELKSFLRNRANLLDSIQHKPESKFNEKTYKSKNERVYSVANSVTTQSKLKCFICKEEHLIYYCPTFNALSISDRIKKVSDLNLCQNCLRTGHTMKECIRTGCRKCKYKHNTLLHRDKVVNLAPSTSKENLTLQTCSSQISKCQVLLATALVEVPSNTGQLFSLRALLDNGSQVNIITTKTAHKLGVKINYNVIPLAGVGDCVTQVLGSCKIVLNSKVSKYMIEIECYVMSEISQNLPQFSLDLECLPIPDGIQLADPTFASSSSIELLIGAGLFYDLLKEGRIKLGKNLPSLTNTMLGWIISGVAPTTQLSLTQLKCHSMQTIHDDLTKFWELESIPESKFLSNEEQYAEEYFQKTISRNEEGRFVVAIPFKDDLCKLGDSVQTAQNRFFSLEKRLQRNDDLRAQYTTFMNEYQAMNHMSKLSNLNDNVPIYIIPHHCVINTSSSTTKLRVVFDASSPSSSGYSRNNLECVGPVVQSDLISIILRFRCHHIAISADIVKMFRQFLVRPEDRSMQIIYWRNDPADNLDMYHLNTITYGTSSAAFLATRCLEEVANQFKETDKELCTKIKEDIYVDDLLTGVDSIEDAISFCSRLNNAFSKFSLPLQKWNSNNKQVLQLITDVQSNQAVVHLGTEQRTKTLGLFWSPTEDHLTYSVHFKSLSSITKRNILAATSQIFDPLGLVGACIIRPKILLQKLWKLKLDWYAPVPDDIKQQWLQFQNLLTELNSVQIPRCIIPKGAYTFQLHGFSDASQDAYGACLYLRSSNDNNVCSNLICAKSKVASLNTLTIPRLELCAALMLAKLLKAVLSSFRIDINNVFLWTDSQIVLCWLNRCPSSLKLFVANRVAQIQEITFSHTWAYVPSIQNPADLISRGLAPDEIKDCSLWWHGPYWLLKDQNSWPSSNDKLDQVNLPDLKRITKVTLTNETLEMIDLNRFSQYRRLINATAYVLRFIRFIKGALPRPNSLTILPDEYLFARNHLIKCIQTSAFPIELKVINSNSVLKSSSPLRALNPFIDKEGLLRVGGRLNNSSLPVHAIHPILLPTASKFTQLLFEYEHRRLGHAGPQMLLNSIRQTFWPLHGKALARKTLHKCVICFRVKPRNTIPQMGALPEARITPSPPFATTGIDYAGPLNIKDRKTRGCKVSKCYIALFVCFCTKALHLEIVSDLTTQGFISALRRFVARRGVPKTIWSDNGLNFVGANNELAKIIQSLDKEILAETFAFERIEWRFIPANSPHFGGLWESGVCSVKSHLKRMIGDQLFTFEEMYTVCCQIEAILNSRPLTTLSDDPNDLSSLTPGHFLIGRQLTSVPDERLEDVPINRLSRYQLIQQLIQHFWRRWQLEYLNTLQQRNKWTAKTPNLSVGDVIIVRSDNSPPMHWPMGG